jgi:surfeit locus 1 family protein
MLLLASAGFIRLGVWQLSRLHQRRVANVATIAARTAPPVRITPSSARTDTLGEHYIVAQGRYDHGHDILLRGEVFEGAPGVEVVTPLLLADGGPAVLVNRGFLPAPDAVSAVTTGTQEPGPQTVRGVALPLGSAPGEPVEHGGRTTWRRLEAGALRQRLPYPILPIYILQTPDSSLPRFPRRIDAPAVDEGPHLSYAIQWFLFAGVAVTIYLLALRQRWRKERASG